MATEYEKEILGLLWGGLMDCGEESTAQRVKNLYEEPLHQIIAMLSALERELADIRPWKAVVFCKAVFQGKMEESKFSNYIHTIQGIA